MLHGTGMKYYLPIHECHKFKPNVGNLFIHGAYGYCMDIYYNIYIYTYVQYISGVSTGMDITNTLDAVDGFKHEPMKPGSCLQNKWNKNMSFSIPIVPTPLNKT